MAFGFGPPPPRASDGSREWPELPRLPPKLARRRLDLALARAGATRSERRRWARELRGEPQGGAGAPLDLDEAARLARSLATGDTEE